MTSSFLDQVKEVGKHFFRLPMEEKVKYSREVGKVEGYGGNPESQPLDSSWVDRLFLTVHPEDRRKLNLWPQNPQSFKETLREYTTKMKYTAETVLKAMAESLELPEKSFLEQYGEKASMLAVFNFYLPCPTPSRLNLGVEQHTDASANTILLQDDQVEGLQVLKDDQWFRVPIVPHALLINIGDQIEIMSNATFKSPMHKVMKKSKRERMTIAMFCTPESDREIGHIEELISEKTLRLYKTMANYSRKASELGKTLIEEARL